MLGMLGAGSVAGPTTKRYVKPMDVIFQRVGDPAADLSWSRRQRELAALADRRGPVDLVVIGGGITGVGVALDAASRGLETVLVERRDLAFGTSRWSSKLVHGGLRYLATGHVDVAWESAVERGHLMTTIAPHLVRAMPQVVPIMSDTPLGTAALTRLGFLAGDVLRAGARTPGRVLPPAHLLSAARVEAIAPGIDGTRLRGGIMAWDGQLVDDARLVVAVARTAAAFGARIITHAAAMDASQDRVLVRDESSGESFSIATRAVIAATGVWAGELDPAVHVQPSRGTHVLFDAHRVGNPTSALTIPIPGMSGRYCFLIPRPDDLVLAGITDVAVDAIEDVAAAPDEDIDWIIHQVNRVLRDPVTRDDVLGAFAGLRPLVTMGMASHDATSDISRKHLVTRTDDGVVTVTGGKLTTYRRMAQDAVDDVTSVPCSTTRIALVGAVPKPPVRPPGFFDPDPWVMRYGAEAPRVRALASLVSDPDSALTPLTPHTTVARVDVIHALLHEGARDASDVIERRLRLDDVDSDVPAARVAVDEVIDALTGAGVH
jgi:glycerol-3-phosphate dehydrogenase